MQAADTTKPATRPRERHVGTHTERVAKKHAKHYYNTQLQRLLYRQLKWQAERT